MTINATSRNIFMSPGADGTLSSFLPSGGQVTALSVSEAYAGRYLLSWQEEITTETEFRIYRGSATASLSLVGTRPANYTWFDDTWDVASATRTITYKVVAWNGSAETGPAYKNAVTTGVRGTGYVYWNGAYTSLYSISATIFVNVNTGTDSGGGTSVTPYKTINKALSVAGPGSVIEIAAGTYIENPSALGYSTVAWRTPVNSSWPIRASGTLGQPIIIRAASGEAVILDGASTRAGINTSKYDYIYIAGLEVQNCIEMGIGSKGSTNLGAVGTSTCNVIDRTNCSRFVVVENCNVHGINGLSGAGENCQAFALWGSSDWIIRNCTISDVQEYEGIRGSGIRWYDADNLLIEHCDIEITQAQSSGIHGKDHYVEDEDGTPVREVEIRYNKVDVGGANAILCSVRGTGYRRAGEYYIHHNTLRGSHASEGWVVALQMGSGLEGSGLARIEHNVIDGKGVAGSGGLDVIAFDDVRLKGNIIVECPYAEMSLRNSATHVTSSKETVMNYCDYNIFPSSGFAVIADRDGAGGATISNFATFEGLASGAYICIGADVGDANVQSTTGALFTNYAAEDYTHAVGSPALALMADGTNAGPYQLGTETIGVV